MNAVAIFSQGGAMMWVILGVSVVACTIAVERALVLFLGTQLRADDLRRRVLKHVAEGDVAKALEACHGRTAHPLPAVLVAGLERANRRPREVEKAMEASMLGSLPRLQRGLGFLGLLGNIATLLGLLGTIFGLIQAFSGVGAATAAARQAVLAEGISVAMYTTAFGIVTAVPILVAHTLLTGRLDVVLTEMEEGAAALAGAISERATSLAEVRRKRDAA